MSGSSGFMRRPGWALIAAGAAGLATGAVTTRAIAGDIAGKAAIEAIVRDYILAHPEIIPEAMTRLQQRESARAITGDRAALETPFAGAWAGDAKGDVTLVMFTDYNCGYCRSSAPDIDRLLAEDPRLRIVWRELPILGPASEQAARAALAAAKQDRYLAFHRAMFAGGRPDDRRIDAVARGAGMDPARLAADRRSAPVAAELDANIRLAARLGVTGTPAFVVGDRMLSGAVGHAALAEAIAAARKAG